MNHPTTTPADLVRILTVTVLELTANDADEVIVALLLTAAAAARPHANPAKPSPPLTPAIRPVATMHRHFAPLVQRALALTAAGLLAQHRALL